MLKNLFWMGVGGFVIYLIMKNPSSQAQLDAEIDKLRNGVHDLIKKYAPSANDQAVASDVMATIPSNAISTAAVKTA
jgi:hypothetical protein